MVRRPRDLLVRDREYSPGRRTLRPDRRRRRRGSATVTTQLAVDIDSAPMRSLGRTFDSARQFGLSAHDAAYVELAGRLRTTLFTADTRVAHAARERKIVTVLVA